MPTLSIASNSYVHRILCKNEDSNKSMKPQNNDGLRCVGWCGTLLTYTLRGLVTLSRFSAKYVKADNICDFVFALLHAKPLQKRIHFKCKEFAPKREPNYFLWEWSPFKIGDKILTELLHLKVAQSPHSDRARPRWLSWMRVRLVIKRLRFDPRRVSNIFSWRFDHERFSTVILSLPLIQKGQLSVSGEIMCTILVNRLDDWACPVKVWLGKLTALDIPLGWLSRKTSTYSDQGYLLTYGIGAFFKVYRYTANALRSLLRLIWTDLCTCAPKNPWLTSVWSIKVMIVFNTLAILLKDPYSSKTDILLSKKGLINWYMLLKKS